MRRQVTTGKTHLQKTLSEKRLLSQVYKVILKLGKKMRNSIKKWAKKNVSRHLKGRHIDSK